MTPTDDDVSMYTALCLLTFWFPCDMDVEMPDFPDELWHDAGPQYTERCGHGLHVRHRDVLSLPPGRPGPSGRPGALRQVPG